MNRLQTALRGIAINGTISLPEAIKLARQFDEQEETSVQLLKVAKQNMGVVMGEQIDEHLSKVEGKFFNARSYDMADKNGEQ